MSNVLGILALVPFWGGLDLLLGKIAGESGGLFGIWNQILAVALSVGSAFGMTPVGVYIAIAMWSLFSFIVIIVNLAMPTKTNKTI